MASPLGSHMGSSRTSGLPVHFGVLAAGVGGASMTPIIMTGTLANVIIVQQVHAATQSSNAQRTGCGTIDPNPCDSGAMVIFVLPLLIAAAAMFALALWLALSTLLGLWQLATRRVTDAVTLGLMHGLLGLVAGALVSWPMATATWPDQLSQSLAVYLGGLLGTVATLSGWIVGRWIERLQRPGP